MFWNNFCIRCLNKMNVVLLFLIVSMLFTACAPQVTATSAAPSIPDQPVTLHFAIADAEGRASDPYVHEFIDQVKSLSNGNIVIEPTWDAGAETTPVFEQGVVKIVKEGQYDLGLAGSRAWDSLGVTSFEALQAPFLITNDALAEAVASSDIAKQMLDGLSAVNVTGLALWPEDLRHPFSVVPGEPILSPHDFEGKTVRVVPSEISNLLIKTLGGSPMFGDDYQRAESGLRQGFSLTGTPIATGNVIFFPKFQVLFVNGAAFSKLSEGQQAIIRKAAEATQKKAIEEHLSETDAATAWCTDGGTIVTASPEQVTAFEVAAKPVLDKIEQDPQNAAFIAAIRELKTKTAPSSGAQACAPVVQASPAPVTESQIWSQGMLPNGVWQANLTTDDFVQFGVRRSVAQSDWAGPYTLTFKDGKYTMDWQSPQGKHYSCEANYQVVEDFMRLTYITNECDGGVDDIQWRIDDQGLHLHLVATKGKFTEVKAFFEAKPWQETEQWSQGLPPNGVWQATLTTDDLVRMGEQLSIASDWVGTYALTFKDGKYLMDWQGLQGQTGKCQANYEMVGDIARLTYFTDADECRGEVDDIQWRMDNEGLLHLHLVAIKNSRFLEMKAFFEAKPWQKIADS